MLRRLICLLLAALLVASAAGNGATAGEDNASGATGAPIIIGYVFETYTPYALQRFFEFSDRDWNISVPCLRDMYAYLQALRLALPWAIRLYDASAYYAGGIYGAASAHSMGATSLRLQSAQLCRRLRDTRAQNITPPFPLQLLLADYQLELVNAGGRPLLVQQQLCLPRSCRSPDELLQILEPLAYAHNDVVRGQRLLRQRCISDDFQPWRSTHLHRVCVYVSLACGYYALLQLLHSRQHSEQTTLQLTTLPFNMANLWRRKFLLHSLKLLQLTRSQEASVFKRPPDATNTQTDCYARFVRDNCLRSAMQQLCRAESANGPQSVLLLVWSLLWTCAQLQAQLGAAPTPTDVSPAGYLLDAYFLLCGCQLAQQFQRTLPPQPLAVRAQLTHLAAMLAQRLICWAPLYSCCMQLTALLDLHLQHNVLFAPPSLDQHVLNCSRQPLWQALYGDSYLPLARRCLPWAWPLALELQLYVAASLLLLLATVQSHYAALIGSVLYTLSLLAAGMQQTYGSDADGAAMETLPEQLARHNLVLPNICLRVAAYLLGIFLGYLLQRCQELKMPLPLNGYVLASGWCAAGGISCLGLLAYRQVLPLLTPLLRAICTVTAHSYVVFLLFWLLLTWRNAKPAGCIYAAARLTPACMLLAPLLIRLFVYAPDTQFSSGAVNASALQLLFIGLSLCCLLYACAAALYLLFTAPLQALLLQLTDRQPTQPTQSTVEKA